MTAATATSTKPAPSKIQSPDPVTMMIDPADIWLDEDNHRIEDGEDKKLLDALACSIKANGQQQPAKVVEEPLITKQGTKRYRLVFGFRRHVACEMVGCKLWAEVMPHATGSQVLELRAIENLDRDSITPVEECLAVSKLYTSIEQGAEYTTQSRDAIVKSIAGRLGRTEVWVRDRLYVHRLPAKVKEWVGQGVIPLVYARELAKIADPGRCEHMAKNCLTYDKPYRVFRSLSWLSNQVSQERFSLRVVPWNVAAAFAGKPACLDCPSNTANDMALFEHDKPSERPEILTPKGLDAADDRRMGVCTNKACHEAKSRAAQAAIDAGIKKVAAAQKKDNELGLGPAALEDAGLMPKILKPSSFARATTNALWRNKDEPKQDKKPEPAAKTTKPQEPTPKDKLEDALYEWNRQTQDDLVEACRNNPAIWAAMSLISRSHGGEELCGWSRAGAKISPALANAIKQLRPGMEPADLPMVVKHLEVPKHPDITDICDPSPVQLDFLAAIATALEIGKPRPKLEQFTTAKEAKPAPKPAKPAKKAGKKGAGK